MAFIYQAATMGEGHVRVAIVTTRADADLLVHRVSSSGLARGDGLWFITREKQNANTWVFFTTIGMAQVKIFFVDTYDEAGWVRPHPYKGKFSGSRIS